MLIKITEEKFLNPESIDFVVTNPHPSEPGIIKVIFSLRSGKEEWFNMSKDKWVGLQDEINLEFNLRHAVKLGAVKGVTIDA